jgi:hypothetical protein
VIFAYGAVTRYGPAFLHGSANQRLGNSHVKGPTTPIGKTLSVWAVSLSLAATDEIDFSFYSTRY